jgi:uncharacterized protein
MKSRGRYQESRLRSGAQWRGHINKPHNKPPRTSGQPRETDSSFRHRMSLDWTRGDLHEGLRCFHSGAFFEAHEHWESVWLMAEEPEKTFLQGLIQVAAAFHHFQRGNCAGTISLLRSALRRLDGYALAFAGIAVEPLCTTIRLWLEALETVSQSPPPPLPQLQLAERGSPP